LTILIPVRPADCDTYGHVNNAAYIAYMEQAFTVWLRDLGVDISSGWMLTGIDSWQPGEIAVIYNRPAYVGQTLTATIWLENIDQEQLSTGCAISQATGEIALQGYAKWRRIDRQSGQLLPLPAEIIAALGDHSAGKNKPAGAKTPVLQMPPDPAHEVPSFRMPHTVHRSEIRAGDWLQPTAFLHWIEEAVYVASASVGWPAERIVGQGMVIVQHRHDLLIHTLPRRGEEVEVVSRVIAVRKIRGTWQHDIVRRADGALLARNWSVGVFMTREGRPCRPPAEMMAVFGWG
jgi:acyl-CoA thioesterase FadM